jgi:hypothetical protein
MMSVNTIENGEFKFVKAVGGAPSKAE